MKKTASIFVLFFYLLSTNGVAFNVNYCCGKVSSISFSPTKDKACRQLKKMPNCCGHKQVYAKLNIQTLTSGTHAIANNAVAIPVVYNYYPITLPSGRSPVSILNCSSSPPGKRQAYILFCSILV